MEWATKMYSPKRYLKDIIATGVYDILPINGTYFGQKTILRECFIKYWYFAEIGFDFDDIFVQRVNSVWSQVQDKYVSLLLSSSTQLNGYKLTKSENSNVTVSPNINTNVSTTDGGSDTFHRQQDDKAFQRASQNSSVESTLDNTTNYGKTRIEATTKSGEERTVNAYNRTDSNEFFDTEKLINYMKETSIYKSFVLEFSNCFMEVL